MNYYEILGVTPESDIAEIKAAYRKLVRKFHPDVNPDGAKSFKEISKAYDTLSDAERRKQYDILNGIFVSKKQDTPSPENIQKEPNKTNPKNKSRWDNKKIKDIFQSVFENKTENAPQPENGEDINADVSVSYAEALYGTSKTINIMHLEVCPRCKGRKFINGSKCDVCSGSGEHSIHKRINVKIPAGIKNSTKLRIKGEGNEGKFGGKNGDLYLIITVSPENDRIKYDGLNILYNLPISPYEAVLGGEIPVRSFDGSIVKVKIPEKTSSGQKFRLAGQGIKKGNKTGDMIVTVTIEIPKHLSDDEVKLYEKLKRISLEDVREIK